MTCPYSDGFCVTQEEEVIVGMCPVAYKRWLSVALEQMLGLLLVDHGFPPSKYSFPVIEVRLLQCGERWSPGMC